MIHLIIFKVLEALTSKLSYVPHPSHIKSEPFLYRTEVLKIFKATFLCQPNDLLRIGIFSMSQKGNKISCKLTSIFRHLQVLFFLYSTRYNTMIITIFNMKVNWKKNSHQNMFSWKLGNDLKGNSCFVDTSCDVCVKKYQQVSIMKKPAFPRIQIWRVKYFLRRKKIF